MPALEFHIHSGQKLPEADEYFSASTPTATASVSNAAWQVCGWYVQCHDRRKIYEDWQYLYPVKWHSRPCRQAQQKHHHQWASPTQRPTLNLGTTIFRHTGELHVSMFATTRVAYAEKLASQQDACLQDQNDNLDITHLCITTPHICTPYSHFLCQDNAL